MRRVKYWWKDNEAPIKFWSVVIVGIVFGIIPWGFGIIYLYLIPSMKWIF